MNSFSDLIGQWPSIQDFSADIGVVAAHGHTMAKRDSIPPDYWPATVKAAEKRGIAGVTLATLADLRSKRYGVA